MQYGLLGESWLLGNRRYMSGGRPIIRGMSTVALSRRQERENREREAPNGGSPARHGRFVTAALVLAVVSLMALASFSVALYALPVHVATNPPAGTTSYVNITISYDPATGTSWFTPTNFVVPAHTKVVVTIRNYDPMDSPLLVPWDNQVIGTLGGIEMVGMGNTSSEADMTGLAPGAISHTFTMFDAYYNLSVPIPPAANSSTPALVSFGAEFNTTGTFAWGCMCRCEDMSEPGMMYGSVDVT